jgi:hypothetical protein
MTDPEFADATYVEPLDVDSLRRIIERERPDAVLPTLGGRAEMSHVNLNDGVCEGLRVLDAPAFSVQHHPEAGPGPHDSAYLFEDFAALLGVTDRRVAPEGYPIAEQGVA